jgi:hypothetical protein
LCRRRLDGSETLVAASETDNRRDGLTGQSGAHVVDEPESWRFVVRPPALTWNC